MQTFRIIDVDSGMVHATADTLERARIIVLNSRIIDWEIWNSDNVCVAWHVPA